MLSSQQIGWNGILVEQYQYYSIPGKTEEKEIPALSDHWLILPLGHPSHLSQKSDNRLHESLFQKGDSLLVPAKKPTYWRCLGSQLFQTELHIHLQPKLIEQVAKASEIDTERIDLANHFRKHDLQLQHIAMLLLAELRSGGIMGRLYVESLTQTLVIHLLRHYAEAEIVQIVTSKNRSLTRIQLQQAIDYIHTHLDQDLSLSQIASLINISPTYFASLFKRTTGISPHQYVIGQRVERAKLMLSKTDLAIADIALQVGFSSQSHLTQQFKRFTGVTPKQVRSSP
ncbi:AraC family transcriptional regulator [Pleurocapsa sp. FMAR1]|uniref:AraC family transcriptional regulator n=1 Tax=Pleurocapsa sp. FMAR1 TaxID=3040204 RepID=UPI0029C7A8F6|nr:AraC family transcriptional regulator [Pleurocapsa sp. FMAR1]